MLLEAHPRGGACTTTFLGNNHSFCVNLWRGRYPEAPWFQSRSPAKVDWGNSSSAPMGVVYADLQIQVAEMRDILDDPTDDEDDYPSPGSGSASSANHQGYLFGFSSIAQSLRNFHPPAAQICRYWKIFKENVDPLIKIFHRPSTEKVVIAAAKSLDHLSKPMEAMMFAIYFAAITSLSEAESYSVLGIEKQVALETYRFGFEQAMARADFLSTQELVVLQSFVLFLTCVRRFDDSRYAWTLTGLVIRMAQALGVHRDGQVFGLSPFETEMRRRLWWQICNLDMRASEDHGSDPSIVEQTFDTKFPLNINDDDIWPGMTEPPEEKEGRTEMLFDLIRFTVSTTVRRLSYAPPGPGPCRERNARITLEDKERLIEELHQYLEKKYLRYCDMSVPLDWVAATVSRLILAKMWLIVHHPFQREDGGAGLPQETKDRLFLTSIEVIEFSCLLETETTTLKWGWLFRTYVQWHAVAFVLSQLCVRTSGPEVEKAWAAVDSVFDEWGGVVSASKRGMLWKPLRKLMARARAARQRELEKQCRFPLDGSIGPSSVPAMALSNAPPPSLRSNGLNGSTNNTMNVDSNPNSSVTAAAAAGFSSPPPPRSPTSSNNPSSTPNQPLDIYHTRQHAVNAMPVLQTGLPIVRGMNAVKNELLPLEDWSSYTDGLLPTTNSTTNNSIFGNGAGARAGGENGINGGGGGGTVEKAAGLGPAWAEEGGAAGVAGWEDSMDWVGWDFMVQDFRMEVENGQGVERGARGGGMINWW